MMKTVFLTLLLTVCGILSAEPLYTFPGDKFGKGPGLTVKGNTIGFAPVSRMYIEKKFDPAGGCFELTAKFHPESAYAKEKRLHYLWSVKGNKRTVASGVISEHGGKYNLNFYVFDTKLKPISCACMVKFPADKSVKLAFIWDTQSIAIKVNGILFAKKNFTAKLQPGESFMIGTAQKDRSLIPMTLEKVKLYSPKQ